MLKIFLTSVKLLKKSFLLNLISKLGGILVLTSQEHFAFSFV